MSTILRQAVSPYHPSSNYKQANPFISAEPPLHKPHFQAHKPARLQPPRDSLVNPPYTPMLFGKKFDGENMPSTVSAPSPDTPSSTSYPTLPSDSNMPSTVQNPQSQNENMPSWTAPSGSNQPSWIGPAGSNMPSNIQNPPGNSNLPSWTKFGKQQGKLEVPVSFSEALKAYAGIKA